MAEPRILRYGVGGRARRAAQRSAGALRAQGVDAAALFKPEYGGWVVLVDGLIRRPPSSTALNGDRRGAGSGLANENLHGLR